MPNEPEERPHSFWSDLLLLAAGAGALFVILAVVRFALARVLL